MVFSLAMQRDDKPLQLKLLSLVHESFLPAVETKFPSNLFILECRAEPRVFNRLRKRFPDVLRNLRYLHLLDLDVPSGDVYLLKVPNSVESLYVFGGIKCNGLTQPLLNLKSITKYAQKYNWDIPLPSLRWIGDNGCSFNHFPNLQRINGYVLSQQDKITLLKQKKEKKTI